MAEQAQFHGWRVAGELVQQHHSDSMGEISGVTFFPGFNGGLGVAGQTFPALKGQVFLFSDTLGRASRTEMGGTDSQHVPSLILSPR